MGKLLINYFENNKYFKAMKQILLLSILFISNMLSAQDLIGTPSSLIIVYNYPDAHFYLQLKGSDKQKTEQENIFIIDNQLVQVKTLNKYKFCENTKQELSFNDFITTYVDWEKDFQEKQFSRNIHSRLKFLKTNNGRDFGLWMYDMPVVSKAATTDTTRITPVQKQIFLLTRVNDYLVGINCPLLETDNTETIKSYLITSIDGIVESDKEINVEELNKQVNK